MNPHFASLVLGLFQQADAALSGELPPRAERVEDGRQLAQVLIDLRFRFVQTMPKA
ncbi:MAG: hypothetical protein ACREMZ_04240 [Gemmatimonadales bacterium]